MLLRLHPTEQERRIIEGKATAQDMQEYLVQRLRGAQTLIRNAAEAEYKKYKAKRDNLRRERYWKLREDPLAVFLEDVFQLDPVSSISSQEIYEIYCSWCSKEHLPAVPIRSLCYWLKHKTNNAVLPCTMVKEGKRCRGFRGLRCNRNNT
jgi:hypothetical protein